MSQFLNRDHLKLNYYVCWWYKVQLLILWVWPYMGSCSWMWYRNPLARGKVSEQTMIKKNNLKWECCPIFYHTMSLQPWVWKQNMCPWTSYADILCDIVTTNWELYIMNYKVFFVQSKVYTLKETTEFNCRKQTFNIFLSLFLSI